MKYRTWKNPTKTNDGLQRQVTKDGTEMEQESHIHFQESAFNDFLQSNMNFPKECFI